MDPREPDPAHRLGPGILCLMSGRDGPDLGLIVSRAGRREALLLNRRSAKTGDLPLISDLAADAEVTVLERAFLAPDGAAAAGPAERRPAALHLAEGRLFLCGRDESGTLATFDVGTGQASTIDVGKLPQVARWRVMAPRAGGVVTVYATEPA